MRDFNDEALFLQSVCLELELAFRSDAFARDGLSVYIVIKELHQRTRPVCVGFSWNVSLGA